MNIPTPDTSLLTGAERVQSCGLGVMGTLKECCQEEPSPVEPLYAADT